MRLPVIAIVGRPNVGKSAFFNAVVGSRVSIVDEVAGVTRDRVSMEVKYSGRVFELIDTGGIGLFDEALLKEEIESQIDIAITSADGILFIVDIREGLMPLDQEVARRLRRLDKPVLLVANKADHLAMQYESHHFHSLGLGAPLPVSALERRSVFEAIELMLEKIPVFEEEEAAEIVPKIAVVGKMNSGKSTLVNHLAQADRVIVSEIPGTTRDSVDVRVTLDGQTFVVIDTAGLRRTKSVRDSVEFYGQARAARAIRRADLVLLMIDVEREISLVDKSIADAILEEYKPCILCLSKWDLAVDYSTETYEEYVNARLPNLKFTPLSFISCKTNFNIKKTFAMIPELMTQAGHRTSTAQINQVLQEAFARRTPRVKKSRVPKVYFGTQVEVYPPTIVVFVNDKSLFNDEYNRYLTGRFRESLPYPEVPIKIIFRGKEQQEKRKS
ncbi:MAG: ribosome biogenesis GTPase Der [Planctomycetota bacterium]